MAKRKTKRNQKAQTPAWWNAMISRREAGQRLAALATGAAMLPYASILTGCGEEVELDALELQQKQGWQVGADGENLDFKDEQTRDSLGQAWENYADPAALMVAYEPKNYRWKPFKVTTLVQSLSQETLRKQVKPVLSDAMKTAYARGLGMREIIQKMDNPSSTMIIADLHGEESVAFGAALADVANVVIGFDNWPHPQGVVPAHRTLGAMMYYAREVSVKTEEKLSWDAPAVILLDNHRLGEYTDEWDVFDNRYVAKVPSAPSLASYKVNRVLYVIPDRDTKNELDDLNDDFVYYKEKNISVDLLPMSDFKPAVAAAMATSASAKTSADSMIAAFTGSDSAIAKAMNASAQKDTVVATPASTRTVYHYGGGPSYWPIFFGNYNTPSTIRRPGGYRAPSQGPSKPEYKPERRPTLFSSRTVGSQTSGVGKQKPTGFGRVSANVNSDGNVTRVRQSRNYSSTGTSRASRSTSTSSSSRSSRSYRSSSSKSSSSRSSSGRSGSFGRSRSSSSS